MSTVHTEVLTMHLESHVSQSYLCYPAGQENPQPGILVIPAFWGLTEHTKSRAYRLAELGYCALALDIYGEGWIGNTAEEAKEAMTQLFSDMDTTTKRLLSYYETLKDLKQVDKTKTASIGYCLGGALSLHLARIGTDLTGVVSFHGRLKPLIDSYPPNERIKSELLVCHGEADTMIPDADVERFKKDMQKAQVKYTFIGYPRAQHGFTDPQATDSGQKFNLPMAYNKIADKKSWKEMLLFFNKVFK